ncbi:hepatic lectin-like isoform X2 [Dicentrarchus labrax]|uniref:hepatic lectin-like isoform X2 n=1 Tax=Dicentrarchus labrax TaxID=13489 RepID=UPI0021F611D9|nr:hepatic lectin-like isoform X2 [Dicentrarchus labrax]
MTLDDENQPDASSREKKLYRLVAVSFGLLCVLQAALNIFLRHALTLQLNSLTGERDELKRELNVWVHYSKQGWRYFNGNVYYISSIKKTWKASRDDCRQKGTDLMIINSEEEQDFTRQLKNNMWIGLTDSETEGTWKWVDGTPLTTSYWMDGEPNNSDLKEDCVEVKRT